jgi:outer membrane protein TolC
MASEKALSERQQPACGRRLRRRAAALFAAALLMLPGYGGAAAIGQGDTLDLKRCIAIALENHPSLRAARGTLQAGESRVGQARADYYPRITGTGSYSRTDPTTSTGGLAAGKAFDNYNSSIALSQNIYDFGRTKTQVNIQSLNRDAFHSDLEDTRSRVVFDVKQTYWGLLQSGRQREVAREVVDQFEQHLARARGFFEVGLRPKYDVTRAEVDLSNAKLALLSADKAYRLARVFLDNAMGVPEAPPYAIVDQLSYDPRAMPLEEALRQAYDRRPDLQALAVRKASLAQGIELARKGYYPFLTGNANYGWGGSDFPLDRGWSFGAQLNIPLFTGFSTKYEVEETQANLAVAAANETQLRQRIHQEVKEAWLGLDEAAERIATAELAVRQAQENLDLATGRYGAGVGSPIEVTDALVALSNAKTARISALYDYKTAQASLERATGEP